jgi:hypothetical protein
LMMRAGMTGETLATRVPCGGDYIAL